VCVNPSYSARRAQVAIARGDRLRRASASTLQVRCTYTRPKAFARFASPLPW
jgi:hypothetical protein